VRLAANRPESSTPFDQPSRDSCSLAGFRGRDYLGRGPDLEIPSLGNGCLIRRRPSRIHPATCDQLRDLVRVGTDRPPWPDPWCRVMNPAPHRPVPVCVRVGLRPARSSPARADAQEAINLFALAVRLKLRADDLAKLLSAYPSSGSNIAYMLA
jgi:hypothetical protein